MKADWLKALEEAANKFWKEVYPQKSFEEKVDYWKKTMEKGMLEQGNLGLPEFDIFNKDWYESVKEQEKDFDKIIDTLFGLYWKEMNRHDFDTAITKIQSEEETE